MDFAADVYPSFQTGDTFSHVAPLPSLLFNSHPSFPVWKSICIYVISEGGGGMDGVLLETIFSLSLTLSIWPDSEPTKLLDHPITKT